MGFDQRIASAMLNLGYDVFPFDAFDDAGRVRVSDAVRFPEHVREGLRRVAAAPAWAEIYRTLSVLDDPQRQVYMAGVGYGRTLNVVLFKAVRSSRDAEAAHQWSVSYQTTTAKSLKGFAGSRHPIDPKWLGYVDDALDRLEQQSGGDGSGGAEQLGPSDTVELPPDGDGSSLAATSSLALGLRFLSGFLSRLTVTTEIRTTVFWMPVANDPVLDLEFASRWKPLHVDYMWDGTIRTAHATWDPRRGIYFGKEVPWKRWLWAMPHEPWEWCRSFWPSSSNCGGPGLVDAAELLTQAIDPAAPLDVETGPGTLSDPSRDDDPRGDAPDTAQP